jgi:TolB protein
VTRWRGGTRWWPVVPAALASLAVLLAACGGAPGSTSPGQTSLPTIIPSVTPVDATAVPPTDGGEPRGNGSGTPGALPVGRLVFDSDRSGNLDIWYLEAGSSEPVQLTTDPGSDRVAAWHPEGESVIFSSDRLGGPSIPSGGALRAYGLFIAQLGGSEDRHLLGTRTFNSGARFSPDGSQIVFASDASEVTQVYVVEPDYEQFTNSEPVALTSDDHNDAPAWSPDGTRIAFSSLRDGNREIYVMAADGSDQTRLTDDPASDGSPAWSPDGSLIAFHSERSGIQHIFVMNADGSEVRQLTDGDLRDGFPSWSPDGEWIAFDRVLARDHIEIMIVRLDGSELTNVTSSPARDAFPFWGN